MDILFQTVRAGQANGSFLPSCLILPFFAEGGKPAPAGQAALDELAPWLASSQAASLAMEDFKAKAGATLLLYAPEGQPIKRVLLLGLGEAKAFKAEGWRNALAKAVKVCRDRKFPSIGLHLASVEAASATPAKLPFNLEEGVEEAAMAALLSVYACPGYHDRSDQKNEEKQKDRLFTPECLCFLGSADASPALLAAGRRASAVAGGIILARNLANGPANIVTPAHMANQAKNLARRGYLRCEVLQAKEIREEGMGAFWAVAQGSATEACLIVLEYAPQGCENDDPVIFVGKGLTFDSGGISLKPAAKMHEMKSDMGGAAALMGLFSALGELAAQEGCDGAPAICPKRRVIGLMPCTENMPGGRAVKPGDVVVSLSGKTIEITNTDAEGRLALCDAMTLAQKRWNPSLLVDIATLTGACVVALGDYCAGLFCNEERLRDHIFRRGEFLGEQFWPLPLWEDKIDMLKSDVADMNNVGPREGGALWAALFLRQFVYETANWAHLDIAGPGYIPKATPTCQAGATGFGVRTLFDLVENYKM